MNNHTDVARARKLVNARLGFYIHLTVFVLVNALLIVINLVTSKDRLWFQWPLLGWGFGILVHAVVTFVIPGVQGKMIDKELKNSEMKG